MSASQTIDPVFSRSPQRLRPLQTQIPHKDLSQIQLLRNHFTSGGLALALAYATMHPLDTLKTRIQANIATGSLAWRTILSKETMQILSKGFTVSVIGAGLQGGARFSTYEFVKSHLLPDPKSGKTPQYAYLPQLGTIPAITISAILGDIASSVFKVPREVVTAKLQTDHLFTASGANAKPANAVGMVRHILSTEGPAGLFRGFWAISARDFPFMVILLVSYENFKAFHHRSVRRDVLERMERARSNSNAVTASSSLEDLEADIPTLKSILFGGVSGFLAGYWTTPMDVLRTRMITYKRAIATGSSGTGVPIDATTQKIARDIYERALIEAGAGAGRVNRGWSVYKAFFKGSIPRSFWWFGICGIFFPTYEILKSVMDETFVSEPIYS